MNHLLSRSFAISSTNRQDAVVWYLRNTW